MLVQETLPLQPCSCALIIKPYISPQYPNDAWLRQGASLSEAGVSAAAAAEATALVMSAGKRSFWRGCGRRWLRWRRRG